MRPCDLTNHQLRQHAENYRKLANWLGASETVSATAAGISAAIEELIARRAADPTYQEADDAEV